MKDIKTKLPLKYLNYTVTCQEVPREISLIINVSGCPYKCRGCHSPELCNYDGEELFENLTSLISKYEIMITCVCFMGGNQNPEDLNKCLKEVKRLGYKTCLYSGCNSIQTLKDDGVDMSILDYVKIGEYRSELGGLSSKTTNQRMYNLKAMKEITFFK